jgi:hypothetical protein
MSTKQDYIGDGVYVEYDGFSYILKANDSVFPSDTIVLEPDVFNSLLKFIDNCKNAKLEKGAQNE